MGSTGGRPIEKGSMRQDRARRFMELHYHAGKAQRVRARAHAGIWMRSTLIASLQDMKLDQAMNAGISTVYAALFRLQIHQFIASLPLNADIATPQIITRALMLSIRPRTTKPHFHESHLVPWRAAAHVICTAYVHKLEEKKRDVNVLILILNRPRVIAVLPMCYFLITPQF